MKFGLALLLLLSLSPFALHAQEIGEPIVVTVPGRNGDGLSRAELSALYEECMNTDGWWQGLPPISDPRFRLTRWEWFRNKPTTPFIAGIPAFAQYRHGAWFGEKFICVAPPDSMQVYMEIKRRRRNGQRLSHYRDSADRETTTRLDLSGLSISQIPEWIYEFRNLKTLNLSGTKVRHLPARLNELDSLSDLYMDRMVHADSLEIDRLKRITFVSAKNNGYEKLPWWVLKFSRLEEIDLTENALDHIPNKFFWLPKIRTVKVSKNPINLDKQWLIGLRRLTNLRLNQCGFTSIHPKVFRLKRLQELQLSDNQISEIPPEIAQLKNLTSLSFYKNQVSTLPPEFYQLQQLKVVDMFYNSLERISPEIGKMDSLEILYLANNRLFDIPDEIAELPKLRELYLHHNRLSDLPNSFFTLKQLRVFHINNNYFMDFPKEILGMKSLVDLDFSYNDIEAIPTEVTQLSDLKLLFLLENQVDLEGRESASLKAALEQLKEQGVSVGY
ncbi:MAG: leucine-rich repeat domain-containing protein [Bacteroidota bacterium]